MTGSPGGGGLKEAGNGPMGESGGWRGRGTERSRGFRPRASAGAVRSDAAGYRWLTRGPHAREPHSSHVALRLVASGGGLTGEEKNGRGRDALLWLSGGGHRRNAAVFFFWGLPALFRASSRAASCPRPIGISLAEAKHD